MGASKTEHFSDEQNTIAIIAKALGHPARIAIVEHLLKVNACICGDIVNELPLAQPTVSQHLKELKNAKIKYQKQFFISAFRYNRFSRVFFMDGL
jgi:DNA-binding transcriptional ArsR family regulator